MKTELTTVKEYVLKVFPKLCDRWEDTLGKEDELSEREIGKIEVEIDMFN